MYSKYIPNIELFISMHGLKEATQSSNIEKTHTSLDEVLLDKQDLPPEKRDDREVLYYSGKPFNFASCFIEL